MHLEKFRKIKQHKITLIFFNKCLEFDFSVVKGCMCVLIVIYPIHLFRYHP